jgi:hypothetical protein
LRERRSATARAGSFGVVKQFCRDIVLLVDRHVGEQGQRQRVARRHLGVWQLHLSTVIRSLGVYRHDTATRGGANAVAALHWEVDDVRTDIAGIVSDEHALTVHGKPTRHMYGNPTP